MSPFVVDIKNQSRFHSLTLQSAALLLGSSLALTPLIIPSNLYGYLFGKLTEIIPRRKCSGVYELKTSRSDRKSLENTAKIERHTY